MGQGPGQSKIRRPSAVGPHGLQSRFWFPEPAPTWIQRGSVWLLLAQAVPATSQGPLILLPQLPPGALPSYSQSQLHVTLGITPTALNPQEAQPPSCLGSSSPKPLVPQDETPAPRSCPEPASPKPHGPKRAPIP